jgi:ParB-like chromosome segregation protein Spo0J
MSKDGYDLTKPIDIAEVDGVRIILDGHHRARAAGSAELQEVPVRVWEVTQETGTRLIMEAAEAAERLGLPLP